MQGEEGSVIEMIEENWNIRKRKLSVTSALSATYPIMTWTELELGPPGWKISAIQLLSYFSTYSPLKLRYLSYRGIEREAQTAATRWFRSQAADFCDTEIQKFDRKNCAVCVTELSKPTVVLEAHTQVSGRAGNAIILPVLLYGCQTWTLTLREEHRLRVFENKVLRKIFGAKRDEVTGEWRKLHNTELHALYSSPDIIRNIKSRRLRWAGHVARMGESRNAYRVLVGKPGGKKTFREAETNIESRYLRWAGHVARMGESRNAYRVLVGRPQRKRPLGRPRCRWEDNIKMGLREVGYDDRDWINLAQDRDRWRAYVRAVMNLQVKGSRHIEQKFTYTRGAFSESTLVTGKGNELANGRSSLPCQWNILIREVQPTAAVKCFVWSVALYGAETWTLRQNEEKRIDAFEMWIWRRMERVKWTDRIRNEAVLEKVGEERMMLKLIRKNCLLKDALEGKVNGRRVRGRRKYQMIDDIKICGP
ncbi:hypothetical protein ANN_16811 [Periplaneta americana]|uniref:Endonuclease-reverse transcriptase n=1 Tax=Periplaneta americana TaxID=6978 RepID=A0ABQ8STA6_PERAM|nr:hypothetical protein ANN_16811 [Periplaneta americana]